MSSNPSEETKKEALRLMKAQQEAGVSESIRRALLDMARSLSIIPDGIPGQLEIAFNIDRRALVIKNLREIASTLEKGFND